VRRVRRGSVADLHHSEEGERREELHAHGLRLGVSARRRRGVGTTRRRRGGVDMRVHGRDASLDCPCFDHGVNVVEACAVRVT
jgi:hypothetical protein